MAFTVGTMVLAIIISALGTSLRAWDRIRSERTKTFSSLVHLLDLMERQLWCLDFTADLARFSGQPLLKAESKKLVFVSRISPMGISKNNSVLVSYSFNEKNRLLSYRQQILSAFGSGEDVDKFIEENDEGKGVETGVKVSKVEFGYRGGEDSKFTDNWDVEKGPPEEVKISVWLEENDRPLVWIVKVAPFGKDQSGAVKERR